MDRVEIEDLGEMARWTAWRRTPTGWQGEGTGPVCQVPPDFRRLRAIFLGDDERRWVSLTRKAVLVESPGLGADPVVEMAVYAEWPALFDRILSELPPDEHHRAVEAVLSLWWAEAGRS